MSYIQVRKKKKYHSKSSIYAMADQVNELYRFCTDHNQVEVARALSFEYVEWKAIRLSAWARLNGVDCRTWFDGMKGTIEGFKVYLGLVEAIEWYCQIVGIKCNAVLDGRFIDYEGFEVIVDIKDKEYKGVLLRGGKYIEGHFIQAEGKTRARYLKPYEINSIKIA